MSLSENNRLMLEIAKGDTRAFRLLAANLSNRMFHLAYRLCGYQRIQAEDIVQEALIKLWRSAPRWQATGPVEAYASRIVYNCCMDYHRRHKPAEELTPELEAGATLAANDAQQIEEQILGTIIDRQNRQILLQAIATLPERQREAILLYYMGEHSQNHVARLLGTTEKSVERLLARGRQHLRKILPATTSNGRRQA